jgi:hypothetical protein
VERLGLVELEAVERSDLVSVGVLLSSPESAVPVLAVGAVTGGKFVTLKLCDFQNLRVIELN